MNKTKWLCFLLVLLFAPMVWSGQISPYLNDYLQDFSTSADVEVIVMFEQQADIQSLNLQLKEEKATLAERNRRVIMALQEVATKTQPSMVAYFDQLQAEGYVSEYKTLWIANMAIVKSTKAGVYAMADNSEIGDIALSYTISGIEPVKVGNVDESLIASVESSLRVINAPAAWAAGYTGAGRVVANMDTGVDGTHPALSDRFRGDVDGDGDCDESWFDPCTTNWPYPQDSGAHGTHTIGTICGRTEAGDTIGVAIEAQWIAAAAIARGGGIDSTISRALQSFQWFADPDGNPETQDNPDAVNNSWGISPYFYEIAPCDETFWEVIDNLEAAGTAVVFAAGNEGDFQSSLRTPADRATTRYSSFCVGSINAHNPNLLISDFSSRGPSYCTPDGEPVYKPEVVAPGDSIRSSVPGGGYTTGSGTSMAAPLITGAIGVIRSANPDLDVETIKEILMTTAHDLGPTGPDNDYGNGLIDLYEACLLAVSGYGNLEGHITDGITGDPITGVLVAIDGSSKFTYTDDAGCYRFNLSANTSYSLNASLYGYEPTNTSDIEIVSNETSTFDFALTPAESGVLEGYVTSLDDTPIEGAYLTLIDTPTGSTRTNSEGYYIFDNIPGAYEYTIEVAAGGYGFASGEIIVPVGGTATVDFSLQVIESFEVSPAGFIGEGVWEWGSPSFGPPGGAYDGNNVWCTVLDGRYPNYTDDALITPQFLVTENIATFSFYHWYYMGRIDGGQILMSLDDGINWNFITPVEGYDYAEVIGLDDTPGYTSLSDGWKIATFELNGYLDERIKFKFRFGSDDYSVSSGWYIDNIKFDGAIVLCSDADLTDSSMYVDIMQGQSETVQMTLSNSGNAPLDYIALVLTNLDLTANQNSRQPSDGESKEGQIYIENVEIKTTEQSPFNYDDVVASVGGPDDFGYTFIDSDEPFGPEYNWIDISDMGSPISFNGFRPNDDGYSDPIPMGMTFEFYGVPYTEIQVSTDGWISFNNYSNSYLTNYAMPGSSNPNNLIAVLWDDLSSDGGDCHYYYDETENQFIVSWDDWGVYETNETVNFNVQVILDGDDNSITMQYGEITGAYQTDISVGIEDAAGEIGLQYAFDNFICSAGLVIKFNSPMFWLTVDSLIGSVLPGESTTLDVLFDTGDLEIGLYYGEIRITTNDPNNSFFSVPCTLNVGIVGIDDYSSSAIPEVFSLNQNYPNPFNPTTEILFGLPANDHVSLKVYDVMGRLVNTLIDEDMIAGTHTIVWHGNTSSGDKVTSGVYFYKLSQTDNSITKKMIMLK